MMLRTFSRLDLLEHCQHWLTLGLMETTSPAAAEGHRKHSIIADYIVDGTTIEEPWFGPWSRHWQKYKPTGVVSVEVPYAYNPEDGGARILSNSSGQRDYSDVREGEICGTSDLIVEAPDVVHNWDWKTGKSCPKDAAGSLQLGAGALCAATLVGVARAEVAYKHVGTKRTTTYAATLDADALKRVRERLFAIATDTTEARPGEHCTELWCPAREVCAAYRETHGLPPARLKQVQQPKPQEAKPMMTLDAIKRGPIEEPHRILLYGVEGIGKSTFGAHAPNPIFIASERGTAELDVARFPEPKTWEDVFQAVESLHGEHDFRTLVFDTVDWLEPLCWQHVCEANNWDTIEKPAWGAGYTAALAEWRRLLDALDHLQDTKRMAVIMLGHCVTRGHRHPELDDFDRFELALNKKAAGLLKQWARTVLFCDYETHTYEEKNRVRAVDSGARWIHTGWRAAFDAKNRIGLPPKLPLSWADFVEACDAAKSQGQGRAASVLALAESFGDEALLTKVREAVKRAGNDTVRLDAIANKLNAKKQQAA